MKFDKIKVSKLKIIKNDKGDIYHALKNNEKDYKSYGEAYFSKIKYKKIKGWKLHKKMKLNLIVPFGKVKFVFYDSEKNIFCEKIIGQNNYSRISVLPKTWFAFQGLAKPESIILNIASIPHEAAEQFSINLDEYKYNWK